MIQFFVLGISDDGAACWICGLSLSGTLLSMVFCSAPCRALSSRLQSFFASVSAENILVPVPYQSQ